MSRTSAIDWLLVTSREFTPDLANSHLSKAYTPAGTIYRGLYAIAYLGIITTVQ